MDVGSTEQLSAQVTDGHQTQQLQQWLLGWQLESAFLYDQIAPHINCCTDFASSKNTDFKCSVFTDFKNAVTVYTEGQNR